MDHIGMMRAAWLSPGKVFETLLHTEVSKARVKMDPENGFLYSKDGGRTWGPLTPNKLKIENFNWQEYKEPVIKKPETLQQKLQGLGKQLGVHSEKAFLEFFNVVVDHVEKKFQLTKQVDEKYEENNLVK